MAILKSRGYTAAAAEAKGILSAMIDRAKAEGRDLDAFETARAETIMAEVNQAKDRMAKAAKANSFLDQANALGGGEWHSAGDGPRTVDFDLEGQKAAPGTGTLNLLASAGTMVKAVTAKADTRGGGIKGLLDAGSTLALPLELQPEPVVMDRPVTTFLQMLPIKQVGNGAQPTWLEQSKRSLNAAPWASGEKPVSEVAVKRMSADLQVIAHQVRDISVYDLKDNSALGQFIKDELIYGLNVAAENQVLNGTGTAPELQGILATSGVQQQAFDTSAIVSVRRALGKLDAQGTSPLCIVMNGADWEAIELGMLSTGQFMLGAATSGAPLDAVKRQLFGVPVALSTIATPGTAVVMGKDSATLFVDEGIRIAADPYTGQSQNKVHFLAEFRAQVGVTHPSGIVVTDVSA